MIGNRTEASILAEWEIERDGHQDYFLPDNGWSFLGEGCERIAWLSPSGVVYKVEHDDSGANKDEYDNIERLMLVPCKGWRLPRADLFEFSGEISIIAMEYVVGIKDTLCSSFQYDDDFSYNDTSESYECDCGSPHGVCTATVWEESRIAWNIDDMHSGNILVEEDGTRVLIDVTN
jgi:hypothetical protein